MEISPFRMFLLLIAAVKLGFKTGVLVYLNCFFRRALGLECPSEVIRERSQRPLPLLHRPLKWRAVTSTGKKLRLIFLFFQDFLVFAVAGIGIVVLNYTFNDGKNRIFTLVGCVIGALLCRISVGFLFRKLSWKLVYLLRCFMTLAFYIIFYPIGKIFHFLCGKLKKFSKNIVKSIANRKKKEYNIYVAKFFMQKADEGFLQKKP